MISKMMVIIVRYCDDDHNDRQDFYDNGSDEEEYE